MRTSLARSNLLTAEFGLSDDELQEAAALIQRSVPGEFTLKKLYGDLWFSKADPTGLGQRFAASVASGQLSGLTYLGVTTANHARYQVHSR